MPLFTLLAFLQDEPKETPMFYNLLLFAGMAAIFYFLLIRPQAKQQKDHQKLVSDLKKGDKIITSGGIWGEIDEVDPQTIRLKLNDKTKIRISRSSVSGMQPAPGENKDAK